MEKSIPLTTYSAQNKTFFNLVVILGELSVCINLPPAMAKAMHAFLAVERFSPVSTASAGARKTLPRRSDDIEALDRAEGGRGESKRGGGGVWEEASGGIVAGCLEEFALLINAIPPLKDTPVFHLFCAQY